MPLPSSDRGARKTAPGSACLLKPVGTMNAAVRTLLWRSVGRLIMISHATRQNTSLMEYYEVKKGFSQENIIASQCISMCLLFSYAVNVCTFHWFLWSVQLHTSIKAQSRYKILDCLTLIAKLILVMLFFSREQTNNPCKDDFLFLYVKKTQICII